MRIAVLLIVFLAGCMGSGGWTKEGSKSQDFKADNAQCEAQALGMSNAIATSTTYFYYTGCMKAKGWTPPAIPKEEHDEPKHEKAKHETSKHESPKEGSATHEMAKEEAPKH